MNEFEKRLRDSLAAHAHRAPDGDGLAEQIIAVTERGTATTPRRSRRRHTWTLPLIAAAAVLAVVLALVGADRFGQSSHHVAAGPTSPAPSATHPPTRSGDLSQPVPTPRPTPTRTVSVLSQDATELLSNVKVLDLSFVGADDGWALATADCLGVPTHSTCTAMLRTSDGGDSWHGIPTPPANVPTVHSCAAPCVQHVRFATDKIGYAFGPSALFMTTDGGSSWTKPAGGADALETLDGNVIRVGTGCLPGCDYHVQIAPIGSTSWQPVTLPGAQSGMNAGVSLARTGSRAFIEIYANTAGGGPATSVLYSSGDDGASWVRRGEPCPQVGGGEIGREVDSTAMTSAADGSLTLLCTPRGGGASQFTVTSADGGATFRHGAVHGLGAAPVSVIGAASASVLFVSSDQTYRSADAGRTWTRLGADGAGGPGELSWFGFESLTDARAVSEGGTTIWTTHDAGVTWVPYSFR